MSLNNSHLWGVILAGGEGTRLKEYVRTVFGHERPKQYCTFIGTRSMLRHTLDRAQSVIPRENLLAVINRHHLPYASDQMQDLAPENIIVQPCCRETAAGILLPLLYVIRRDPEAIVALFPSDHFILQEVRFMGMVAGACEFASAHPRLLVVLGVDPQYPETEYGWLERERGALAGRDAAFYRVKRFWEKPDEETASALQSRECLWNTFVSVGKAKTLLALIRGLLPELERPFRKLEGALGSTHERQTLEEVFASIPPLNFSRSVLERIPERLRVLGVTGVYWSDWGDPRRIQNDVERFSNVFRDRLAAKPCLDRPPMMVSYPPGRNGN
jgi:mannose-1-phosphate guanylyltransferase